MGVIEWIAVIVGLFIVTAVIVPLIAVVTDHIVPIARQNSTTEGQNAIDFIEYAFLIAPIILIVGLILFGFASTQKKEPLSTYEGM